MFSNLVNEIPAVRKMDVPGIVGENYNVGWGYINLGSIVKFELFISDIRGSVLLHRLFQQGVEFVGWDPFL